MSDSDSSTTSSASGRYGPLWGRAQAHGDGTESDKGSDKGGSDSEGGSSGSSSPDLLGIMPDEVSDSVLGNIPDTDEEGAEAPLGGDEDVSGRAGDGDAGVGDAPESGGDESGGDEDLAGVPLDEDGPVLVRRKPARGGGLTGLEPMVPAAEPAKAAAARRGLGRGSVVRDLNGTTILEAGPQARGRGVGAAAPPPESAPLVSRLTTFRALPGGNLSKDLRGLEGHTGLGAAALREAFLGLQLAALGQGLEVVRARGADKNELLPFH
jgi:hypothetical protein